MQLLKQFFIFTLVSIFLSSQFAGYVSANISFQYDANGNLAADDRYCYAYNDANKLQHVDDCEGNLLAEYEYDYQGKRLYAVFYENGEVSRTHYYPNQYYELEQSPSLEDDIAHEYIYADTTLVAEERNGESSYFYLTDHLGSVRAIVDQSGQLVQEYQYDPFGNLLQETPLISHLFTGQKWDDAVEYYYYGARYYNPIYHQFLQPDQIIAEMFDPQQLNPYTYARNNPVKYADSTGNYLDTAIDVALLAYDVTEIVKAPDSVENWVALGADAVGMAVPGLTGGGIAVRFAFRGADYAVTATKNSKVANYVNKATQRALKSDKAVNAAETTYKTFTAKNFRENLAKLTGKIPLNADAHHVFPQVSHLQKRFEAAGINIHDPRYGSWWDATPGAPGGHRKMVKSYQQDWERFFDDFKKAKKQPSMNEILNKGRNLSSQYGFSINY